MKAGLCLQALLYALLTGCGLCRSQLDRELLAEKAQKAVPERLAELYSVRFPDLLDIQVDGRPDLTGQRALRVDGKVDLTAEFALAVEGKTTPQIARLLATLAEVPPEKVQVRVHDYRSQRLFLQGEVAGDTRAVSYIGPETVLEMLRRVGGITAGASPGDIQVIRAQVAEGRPPEVFDVNLEAILLKNDQETNIKLRPFDQVRVGQRKSCTIQKCLPPWMRPLFAKVCGLSRSRSGLGPPQPALAERASPRYRANGLE